MAGLLNDIRIPAALPTHLTLLSILSIYIEVLLPTPFVHSTMSPIWNCSTAVRPTAGFFFFFFPCTAPHEPGLLFCVIKETHIECAEMHINFQIILLCV